LRSLRLVGRVVVALALVLVLSARLVGQGTIYHWVGSTCWLAAVPVYVILVRWWRETVLERVDRVRKKSPLQAWVLAHRSGWRSFFAAAIGAAHLFFLGAFKVARNWLAGFNLARRAHAYLFKRELDRLANTTSTGVAQPLARTAYQALDPDVSGVSWVDCPADAPLARLTQRAGTANGGLVAVVADRGAGKSTLLRELMARVPGAVHVHCSGTTPLEAIREALAREEGQPAPSLVLLDDAQALIKPVVRGLVTFDAVVAFARSQDPATLWVFAVDAVLWPFLSRSRDARPLFDAVHTLLPWNEEQISDLVLQRSAGADIDPTFEDLLEKLPATADEIDRQDALLAKRAGYCRMLWDYTRGNPGMALEIWRTSLVQDASGVVRVRPLQVADATDMELLPDAALFILRAVLQMAPAQVADVALATRMSEAQVLDTFQFALARGYLVGQADGVRVPWRWLRPVMRLLERRHLLVNP
jgi:hypothetical protein